jgi:DNA-binding MarR family transcriptional regulator
MTNADGNKRNTAPATPEGGALLELMWEVAQTFFKLRAAGKRVTVPGGGGEEIGAVAPSGAGTYGLMRSLAEGGPQTVPAIARARPVARQHIQTMANEMAAQGLVKFVDNPAHKRSRLLRLTPAGERLYEDLSLRMSELADGLAQDMDIAELRTTVDTLRKLARKLAPDARGASEN